MNVRRSTAFTLLGALAVAALMIGAQAQARSAATLTIATHQNEISPGNQNMGWWDDAATHVVGNDNYEVGNAPDEGARIFRNFFSFDTSLAGGNCASAATLQIPIGEGSGDFGGVQGVANYVFHDVSTPASTLITAGGPDLTVYHDLGTGTVYGGRVLPTVGPYPVGNFPVSLNAAGLAALNAAIKAPHPGYFTVGGMIKGEPADTSLFGFTPENHSGQEWPVRLVLTLGSC